MNWVLNQISSSTYTINSKTTRIFWLCVCVCEGVCVCACQKLFAIPTKTTMRKKEQKPTQQQQQQPPAKTWETFQIGMAKPMPMNSITHATRRIQYEHILLLAWLKWSFSAFAYRMLDVCLLGMSQCCCGSPLSSYQNSSYKTHLSSSHESLETIAKDK